MGGFIDGEVISPYGFKSLNVDCYWLKLVMLLPTSSRDQWD
jgi:hypothetical protein